jgi:hypothetical protein
LQQVQNTLVSEISVSLPDPPENLLELSEFPGPVNCAAIPRDLLESESFCR